MIAIGCGDSPLIDGAGVAGVVTHPITIAPLFVTPPVGALTLIKSV